MRPRAALSHPEISSYGERFTELRPVITFPSSYFACGVNFWSM
eukprot:SAG11_NODE_15041_length_591_cov_0.506098_1_plen_42_part_10